MTFIWAIFQDLHGHRSMGFSANPLSMTDMINYLKVFNVNDDEMKDCLRYLDVLDNTYLTYQKERSNAKSKCSN